MLGLILIFGPLLAVAKTATEIADARREATVKEQKKREKEREIYEKNIEIINSVEKKPELLQVSNTNKFSCAEEKRINLEFRELIKNRNALTSAKAHEEYLSQKVKAYQALGQVDEAEALESEIQKSKETIAQCSERKVVFRDLYNGIAYKDSQIKTGLSDFVDMLTKRTDSLLSEFFQGTTVKIVSAGYGETLLFFPGYALRYSENNVAFSIRH